MNFSIKRLPYLFCYIIAFVLGMKYLREPDIWWQLLSGRWMLEHGQVTKTDVFSFTMAGKPWINVKWLYEIIIGLLEKAAGPEGVILLQAIVNVAIVYLLFQIIKLFSEQLKQPVTDFASAIAALLFLALVEYRMAGRPEMVSHLMCTVYLFILWKHPQMEWKKVWWLVLLQCLWANMHEGYPVGMVMLGANIGGNFLAYIFKKDKTYLQQGIRALTIFAASAVAILLNPNGITLWKQPFEIYRQVGANKYTTELYSVTNPDYWTIQAKGHVALLAVVTLFWIIRIIAGRKQKNNGQLLSPVVLTYFLLIPLFGYLSLTANRNIPFAQILLYPSVPYMLAWIGKQININRLGLANTLAKRSVAIFAIIAIVFYVSVVTNKYYKATDSPNRYGIHISMLHNPTGAANFIRDYKLKGPMFSDYFVSSYLLWDLFPDFKSYIDLRDLDVFPSAFFNDYFAMYENPQKFDSLNKIYKFNYIVLSNSQLIPVQQKFYWGEAYNLIYADPVASIYLRNDSANYDLNHDQSVLRLFPWPQAPEDPAWATLLTKLLNPANEYPEEDELNRPISAANFYNQMQNFHVAIRILQPEMPNYEDNAEAYATMGTSMLNFATMMAGPEERPAKMDSARMYLEHAIQIDEHSVPRAYASLGDIAMMKKDGISARKYYEQSIEHGNATFGVYYYLAMACYFQLKMTNNKAYGKDMIKALNNSIDLNPDFRRSYVYLADAYHRIGNNTEARKNLIIAKKMTDKMYREDMMLMEELQQALNVK